MALVSRARPGLGSQGRAPGGEGETAAMRMREPFGDAPRLYRSIRDRVYALGGDTAGERAGA